MFQCVAFKFLYCETWIAYGNDQSMEVLKAKGTDSYITIK